METLLPFIVVGVFALLLTACAVAVHFVLTDRRKSRAFQAKMQNFYDSYRAQWGQPPRRAQRNSEEAS